MCDGNGKCTCDSTGHIKIGEKDQTAEDLHHCCCDATSDHCYTEDQDTPYEPSVVLKLRRATLAAAFFATVCLAQGVVLLLLLTR